MRLALVARVCAHHPVASAAVGEPGGWLAVDGSGTHPVCLGLEGRKPYSDCGDQFGMTNQPPNRLRRTIPLLTYLEKQGWKPAAYNALSTLAPSESDEVCGRCPLHHDSRPSFYVNRRKNVRPSFFHRQRRQRRKERRQGSGPPTFNQRGKIGYWGMTREELQSLHGASFDALVVAPADPGGT